MPKDLIRDLSLEEKLDLILSRLDNLNARLTAIETKPPSSLRPAERKVMAQMAASQAGAAEQLAQMNERLAVIEFRLSAISNGLLSLQSNQKQHSKRTTKLGHEQA